MSCHIIRNVVEDQTSTSTEWILWRKSDLFSKSYDASITNNAENKRLLIKSWFTRMDVILVIEPQKLFLKRWNNSKVATQVLESCFSNADNKFKRCYSNVGGTERRTSKLFYLSIGYTVPRAKSMYSRYRFSSLTS